MRNKNESVRKNPKNLYKRAPKLRFAEFRSAEEWEVKSLSDISLRITEKVGNIILPTVSISAGIGFVLQTEKFGRDISGEQYKNYIVLNNGEFSYNKGNSKKYPQGCIYKLVNFKQVAAPNAFISFKMHDGYISDFFRLYFEANYHGEQLKKFITSGARSDGLLNISPDDFFTLKFPSPKKSEQQKIADCFSSLDDLIAAHMKTLEVLKAYKKGMMQRLFPAEGETAPKLRFLEFRDEPKWEEKPLSAVSDINPVINQLPERFVYIDLESVISGRLLFKKRINRVSAPSRAQRLLRNGDVIFQMVRPYQRNNLLCHFDDGYDYVASTGYAQLRPFGSSKYLFQLIHTDPFVEKVLAKCTGSSYPAIRSSDLAEIIIMIPALSEQQKVADSLSSLDDLISAQSAKIDALKEHKKGLMQQLFPSPDEASQ